MTRSKFLFTAAVVVGLVVQLGAPSAGLAQTASTFLKPVTDSPSVRAEIAGKQRTYHWLGTAAKGAVPSSDGHGLAVRGPGTLRILTRTYLPPNPGGSSPYGLNLRIDGGPTETITFEAAHQATVSTAVPGRQGTLSALRSHAVRLGRGHHYLEVTAWPPSARPRILVRYQWIPEKVVKLDWMDLTPRSATEPVEVIVREHGTWYHRNVSGEPFEVEVIGPTELRIFTRLEHSPDMRGGVRYRAQVLEVDADDRILYTFQLRSRRSGVATFRDQTHLVPGKAQEIVIPVPQGTHRYRILPLDGETSTLLARFMLPKSAMDLEE